MWCTYPGHACMQQLIGLMHNLAVLLCRHAGPLATLPSVLLMQGTINLGLGTVLGTQGALYFHQK